MHHFIPFWFKSIDKTLHLICVLNLLQKWQRCINEKFRGYSAQSRIVARTRENTKEKALGHKKLPRTKLHQSQELKDQTTPGFESNGYFAPNAGTLAWRSKQLRELKLEWSSMDWGLLFADARKSSSYNFEHWIELERAVESWERKRQVCPFWATKPRPWHVIPKRLSWHNNFDALLSNWSHWIEENYKISGFDYMTVA